MPKSDLLWVGGPCAEAAHDSVLGVLLSQRMEVRVEDGELELRHLLHGVAQALAPRATLLHAAIGHVVGTVGRDVVDDDAADLELLAGVECLRQVMREDTMDEAQTL